MKQLKHILTALCLGCVLCASGALPHWEHISNDKPVYESVDADKVEVSVRDGYIYIATPKPVTVKVMSIVGQLISQQNVAAGVSRLRVTARGVYILKAGTYTLRVSV